MPTDPSASNTLHDSSGDRPIDTARADAVYEAMLSQGSVVEMHRRIAMRLLREGSPVQAFQELVRASRAVPMNPRLAASLALLALHAKTFGPALTLLKQGLDETEDDERIAVMRQLARLARRSGDLERGREVLTQLLAERPADRRARAVLNSLLEREERWEELDGSLDRETRFALKRGALVTASLLALRRARVWDTRHEDHARAALRYLQAAQFAEQAHDFERAFVVRLLWLRALHRAEAPDRALDDAATMTLAAGERVNQRERARALIDELGLTRANTPASPLPAATAPRRVSTQLELVAVAEAAERAGHRSEAAAVLAVAVREGPDPRAARKLEALHIRRGSWRELAVLYRDLVARSGDRAERAGWAEKLAELLESELDDVRGAAAAWAEVVAATGDARAVSEQVRLLSLKNDGVGVRAALDAGVTQAHSPAEKASALVLRAEESLSRREVMQARTDFQAALDAVADHPQASAGLAELAAMQGEPALIRSFEAALTRLARHARGRGDLYRRLARLAEVPLQDTRLALVAWAEVLVELPGDAEATTRSIALTREADDGAALERQLRAAIANEPRGPKTRVIRLDLVALLDRLGRPTDALAALKDAVRMEPGHREAWLAYADRLSALGGRDAEVAWSLEHAATATEDPTARAELWRRLGRFARERLADEQKAASWERRADRIEKDLETPEITTVLAARPERKGEFPDAVLPGGPIVIPPRRAARPKPLPQDQAFEAIAAAVEARVEPPRASRPEARPSRPGPGLSPRGAPSSTEERVRPSRPLSAAGSSGVGEAYEEGQTSNKASRAPRPASDAEARSTQRTAPNADEGSSVGDTSRASRLPAPSADESSNVGDTSRVSRPVSAAESRPPNVDESPSVGDTLRAARAASAGGARSPQRTGLNVDEGSSARDTSPASRPASAAEARSTQRTAPNADEGAGVSDTRGSRPASVAADENLSVGEPTRSSTRAPAGSQRTVPAASASIADENSPNGERASRPASPEARSGTIDRSGRVGDAPVVLRPVNAPADMRSGTPQRPVAPTDGRSATQPPGSPRAESGEASRPMRRTTDGEIRAAAPATDVTASMEQSAIELALRTLLPAAHETTRGEQGAPATDVTASIEQSAIEFALRQGAIGEGRPVSGKSLSRQGTDGNGGDGGNDDEVAMLARKPPTAALAEPDDEGTSELPVPISLGDPLASLPPSFGPLPSSTLNAERVACFDLVRANPLEPDGYKALAEHFDTANDPERSSLMLEIARALEGDPHAAPRRPRLILNVEDRAGLRHPALRGDEGELLSLAGLALCSLYPARGRDAGTNDEFHLDSGKGAKSCAEALLAAVRILGLRAPDVFVSEDSGPPFFLVFAGVPKLLVGRLAVRRELDGAELRFFAGRALFTQQPDLMALRNLRREQLFRGLSVIAQVARGRTDSAEARVVRDAIPQRSWERVRQLTRTALPTLDVAKLADGARHAVNRAGLVVCGGVAPALAALKAKKALPAEAIELVRFAASERYLQLRGRVLGHR